jgi:hypothetical protein
MQVGGLIFIDPPSTPSNLFKLFIQLDELLLCERH